jgi:hypothetical protein
MRAEQPFIAALLVAATLPLFGNHAAAPVPETAPEPAWPARFEERPLTRLPLSPEETRWTSGFPGHVARFTDGERQLLFRRVDRPTRALHPAADCFRGIGYRVAPPEIRRDAAGQDWRCFRAEAGDGTRRGICERIADEAGRTWTDVSSWYWDTVLERSRGPWWAITVVGGG